MHESLQRSAVQLNDLVSCTDCDYLERAAGSWRKESSIGRGFSAGSGSAGAITGSEI